MKLRLGISTCPNDIFAFHAILKRKVDLRGLEFDVQLLDVQELNERLAAKSLDCSKASFHAALNLSRDFGVFRSGAAIGMGVGPVLLAARAGDQPNPSSRILCPGADTTAALLFRCLFPECKKVEHRVFSEIMPAMTRSEADFGAVIHEGRFTYQQQGLALCTDLGARWEERTNGPVPLGGILGRLDLATETHVTINRVIRDSIQYAFAHRDETFVTMQHYAQELEPAVIWSHVELYVNEMTIDLGQIGEAAIRRLRKEAINSGVIPEITHDLKLLGNDSESPIKTIPVARASRPS